MKAVVTGGAGFIGSHVAEELLRLGHEVLVIDDCSGGFESNVPAGASFRKMSVNDPLDRVFSSFKPDLVYHLAAYAAEGLSHHIPVFNVTNNVTGTANVLAASYRAGVRHFVFTSSIAAYGHPHGEEAFSEETPLHPCDPYGVAKMACEYHLASVLEYFGRPDYTIFRPHNVFGPRQNIADPYRNVVGIFMARALAGEPMPIFGDGSQTRSFSEVTAVAQSIAAAPFVSGARNRSINIGGDEAMSVLELAKTISRLMGVPERIELRPARKEVVHAHCRHDLAHSLFPEIHAKALNIERGLERMVEYVGSHPIPSVTECPSPIEIFDQLPPSWRARLV